jgi:hypothetical protein
VPERSDDFAWENDKIAFRAYGPALKDSVEDSGFDCWLKRVDYPIIDKWYKENAEGKSYHTDHGEGYDPYKVGASRGCGGLGLWLDDKLVISNVFTDWRIVKCEPAESVFILSYHYAHGADTYTEEKQISIHLGDRLFKSVSTFRKNGALAADLPIAIGLVMHGKANGTAQDLAQGWLSYWETLDGSGLGTGVVIDPARIVEFRSLEVEEKLGSHALLITRTDAHGQLAYFAGYGWERAGEIRSAQDWNTYLSGFASP